MRLGLIAIVVLVLVIARIVVGLVRRGRCAAAPSCGVCGYAVEGLVTGTCPECGAELIRAGITTAQTPRPVPRVYIAIVWTAAVIVAAWILSWLAIEVMPGLHQQRETARLRLQGGAVITMALDGDVEGNVARMRSAELGVSGLGQRTPPWRVDLDEALGASPWHRGGAGMQAPGVDAADMLVWLERAGADPTDPRLRREARQLTHLLLHRAAFATPGDGVSLRNAGDVLGSMSAKRGARVRFGWAILAFWGLVWAGGLVWLTRLVRERAVRSGRLAGVEGVAG